MVLLILILFLSSILPRFLIDLEGFRGMSTPYSTYIGNQPIDSRVSNLIDPNQEKTCKKIFGFDGLYCNPDSQKGGIDVFYGLSRAAARREGQEHNAKKNTCTCTCYTPRRDLP
jgi:hypothetical protein